jgi:anti-repressor protein
MNELLTININENQEPVMSARDLHEFLEIDTPYHKWFPRMTEYGFSENTDYIVTDIFVPNSLGGKQTVINHIIKLDMAKEIAMIQRSEKGKQARQYFLQIEKEWNSPEKVMARALLMADKKIHLLTAQIEADKPKVEFFDQVADSKDAIDIGSAAKVLNLGIGRNRLFEVLRDKRILMNDNKPYQTYIDRGYFRVIEQKYTKPDGSTNINIKTLVYQRGLDYIRKVLTA